MNKVISIDRKQVIFGFENEAKTARRIPEDAFLLTTLSLSVIVTMILFGIYGGLIQLVTLGIGTAIGIILGALEYRYNSYSIPSCIIRETLPRTLQVEGISAVKKAA
jgi:hypothetical protein